MSGGKAATSAALNSGVSLTKPTVGLGQRIRGGTVTWAEQPGQEPNYISPMYTPEYCETTNISDLSYLLYRPVYWFGNDYSPRVDYDDSIGRAPVYSNGGKTVTIHLKKYMWSDGEEVSARDLVFWMNVMKADPSKEWCGYVPGKFPDNVTSYKAVGPTTFQLTFNKRYNRTWLLYNELQQLTPMPIAWDRTALSQKAPDPSAPNLPDTTTAGAAKVFDMLNAQAQKLATWGSSSLWSVVDGPWKVASTTANGGVTFVPNRAYSGSPKAVLSRFVEVPFTSEAAMVDELKSQGPSSLTISYIPLQFVPLTSQFKRAGYDVSNAFGTASTFIPLNENAPRIGVVFRQLYFRQAFQHLIDQSGWIKHFLYGDAVPTYGPIPALPHDDLLPSSTTTNPYPFSVSDAARLLKAHGWKVVAGGVSTCIKPGTGSGECGAGIAQGQGLAFNLDYTADVQYLAEEMEDLHSQASRVGIKLELTTHPSDDVAAAIEHCAAGTPVCRWVAENMGIPWTYSDLPTGDSLYYSKSLADMSNYSSAKMDALVDESLAGPAAQQPVAMREYVRYAEQQLPYAWTPETETPTLLSKKLGGYTANTAENITPEDWYLTR